VLLNQTTVKGFATAKPPADDKPKRKRRTKAEILSAKLDAELLKGANILEKAKKEPAAKAKKSSKKTGTSKVEPQTMYTLKFNSPILPYAKFPLT